MVRTKIMLVALMAVGCLALALVSCAPEVVIDQEALGKYGEDAKVDGSGNVTIVFSDAAGQKEIDFSSKKDWTTEVSGNKDSWVVINPKNGKGKEQGKIRIMVGQNGYDERTAVLKIISEDLVSTVTIVQKQKDALTVTQSQFSLPAEGGSVDIEVKANIDFTCSVSPESSSWIKKVDTKGLKTTQLKFTVSQTDQPEEREGTITITSGKFSEVITVTQAPLYYVEFEKDAYSVGDNKGEFTIKYSSNVKLEATVNDDWIKSVSVNKPKEGEAVFSVVENPSVKARKGSITFTSKDGFVKRKISVTQEDTLYHCNNYGVFKISAGKGTPVMEYEPSRDQYQYTTEGYTYAIQNYDRDEYVSMTCQSKPLAGYKVNLDVVSLGLSKVSTGTFSTTVLQRTSTAVWLLDKSNNIEYVMCTVKD